MKRTLVLILTHLGCAGLGFALGIYALPILMAPAAPSSSEVASLGSSAAYTGEFRRDLVDSDFLHWGEGTVSIGPQVITFQGEDGMFHQLLDDPESYPEASCTGMFVYALATGLDYGWLSFDENATVTASAWDALAGFVDEEGRTESVCIGTNAKNSKKHYLTRPTKTGNFHGQAAVLWSATAILRLNNQD